MEKQFKLMSDIDAILRASQADKDAVLLTLASLSWHWQQKPPVQTQMQIPSVPQSLVNKVA
jgi:hypothetical protein